MRNSGSRNFCGGTADIWRQPVEIYRVSDAGLAATDASSIDGNALAEEIARKDGLRTIPLETEGPRLQNLSFQNQRINPQTALRALGSIALIERRRPGRKLLVWVGYHAPTGENSFEWVTEFSTRLREARITLFGVTFWKSPDQRSAYDRFLAGGEVGAQCKRRRPGV